MNPRMYDFELTDQDTQEPVPPLQFNHERKANVKLQDTASWLPKLDPDGTKVVVCVPTLNSHKIGVIKRVAENKFGTDLVLYPQKIDSGENRQPLGSLEGISDVCERMNTMLENFTQSLDGARRVLVVGIESFVEPADTSVDYAVEIVYDIGGNWEGAFTRGCIFPSRHVNEAKNIGTTVGKVISANNTEVEHHDPHQKLCQISRYDLLTETLEELFDRFG